MNSRPHPGNVSTRVNGWDRIAIIGLGLAAFAQSFDALRQMAEAIHVRRELTWLFPLLIDGFIAYGIRALLVLRDARLRARVYVWSLVGVATATSVWANALHAVRLNQQTPPKGLRLDDLAVGILSTASPLAIAGAVHLYIVLDRDTAALARPRRRPTNMNQAPGPAPAVTATTGSRPLPTMRVITGDAAANGLAAGTQPDDSARSHPGRSNLGASDGNQLAFARASASASSPRPDSVSADATVNSVAESDPGSAARTPVGESATESAPHTEPDSPARLVLIHTPTPMRSAASASAARTPYADAEPPHRGHADSGRGRPSAPGPNSPYPLVRDSGTRSRPRPADRNGGSRRQGGRRAADAQSADRRRGEPVSDATLLALARTAPRLPDGRLSRKQITAVIRSHGHRISSDRINELMAALREHDSPN